MQLLNIQEVQQVAGGCSSTFININTELPWSAAAQIMTDMVKADNDFDMDEDLASIASISNAFKQANIDPMIHLSISFSLED